MIGTERYKFFNQNFESDYLPIQAETFKLIELSNRNILSNMQKILSAPSHKSVTIEMGLFWCAKKQGMNVKMFRQVRNC